jgi:hypothetical protein
MDHHSPTKSNNNSEVSIYKNVSVIVEQLDSLQNECALFVNGAICIKLDAVSKAPYHKLYVDLLLRSTPKVQKNKPH